MKSLKSVDRSNIEYLCNMAGIAVEESNSDEVSIRDCPHEVSRARSTIFFGLGHDYAKIFLMCYIFIVKIKRIIYT